MNWASITARQEAERLKRTIPIAGSFGGLGAGSSLGKQGFQRSELLFCEAARLHARPDVVRLPGQLIPEERPELDIYSPGRLWGNRGLHANMHKV